MEKIDTSGRVECKTSIQPLGWIIWSDLTPFQQGFVEAALRELPEGFAGPVWGFSDLAPETLARFMEDCASVEKRIADRLCVRMSDGDFYRLRTERFQTICAEDRGFFLAHFPPIRLYLADDGKIRATAQV